MRLTVLGCGSSSGVPSVSGFWGQCDKSDPKNYRTRMCVALHTDDDEVWLIDAGTDIRAQLIREGITRVHGVFLTHSHADHILGLDDLRSIFARWREPIPVYGDKHTLAHVDKVFGYLIDKESKAPPRIPSYQPFLRLNPLEFQPADVYQTWCKTKGESPLCPNIFNLTTAFSWKGQEVKAFFQDHGGSHSLGYRFGDFAYSTDVKNLSDQAFQMLKGVKTWLVDCISDKPSHTHAHLPQTLEWIRRVNPEKAVLIHMSAHLDFKTLAAQLPRSVVPAYDGLVIDL